MAASSRHRSSATPLVLVYAALLVYASLFPFTGWRWPPGQAPAALLALPWPPWHVDFDVWANLLGYLPLGALVMWAARRSGVALGLSLALAVLGPALMSYVAEVAQHFVAGRHPSLKDLAANSAGALLGALAAAIALQVFGLGERWQGVRERWFEHRSAGALALLTLWPLGLLFPAPVALGLGQVGDRLRETLSDWLMGVPWAEPVQHLLALPPPAEPLRPLAEGLVTALGLLAPCLLAYTVTSPGWRRVVMAVGALLLAMAAMTLSTLLNFGPQHALAWLTPVALPALVAATLLATLLAPLGRRVAAGLALVVLGVGVALVSDAPADPYFAQSLRAWEQGRWVRFHGLAQWIGWLWPYAAMAWLLARLGARGE